MGPFETRLTQLLGEGCFDSQTTEENIQSKLAAKLRSAAVNHLAVGNEEVAIGFRNSFRNDQGELDVEALQNELNDQADHGVTYGNENYLIALAELLGFYAVISDAQLANSGPVTHYKPQFQGKDDPTAPVVHLVHNVNHYYQYDRTYGSTRPDNNCLYNSIAQQCWRRVQEERHQLSLKTQEAPSDAIVVRAGSPTSILRGPSPSLGADVALRATQVLDSYLGSTVVGAPKSTSIIPSAQQENAIETKLNTQIATLKNAAQKVISQASTTTIDQDQQADPKDCATIKEWQKAYFAPCGGSKQAIATTTNIDDLVAFTSGNVRESDEAFAARLQLEEVQIFLAPHLGASLA